MSPSLPNPMWNMSFINVFTSVMFIALKPWRQQKPQRKVCTTRGVLQHQIQNQHVVTFKSNTCSLRSNLITLQFNPFIWYIFVVAVITLVDKFRPWTIWIWRSIEYIEIETFFQVISSSVIFPVTFRSFLGI